MASYLAIVCGTGVAVPIDRMLAPAEDVAYMLEKAQCEAVIFSEGKKGMVEEIASELPSIKHLICMDDVPDMGRCISFWQMVEKGRKLAADGDRAFVDAQINARELAILLFTSGTTAASKAVMLCHHNIASNVHAVASSIDLREGDITYSLLPLHHTYECMVELMFLYCGASVAVCEGLRHIPDNLQEVKPTLLVTVPSFLEKVVKKIVLTMEKGGKQAVADIIKSDPNKLMGLPSEAREMLFSGIKGNFGGNLRLIFSGAAPLENRIRDFLLTLGLDVLVGHGLTETSPVNTLFYKGESTAFESSIGKAIPNVQVKISNPDSDGNGEICIKGPNVMLGYMDDEEATRAVIDNEGWFSSGDMGFMDENGFIHINGRKREMIVLRSGLKVFPQDIEPKLNAYPIVKEAIICNISSQGKKERVGAIVVIDDDFIKETAETRQPYEIIDEIIDEVNANLADYKRIREFKIRTEEFPKTTTSKIKRHLINWE
jgi:long-chain acyl-CoA synthetase